MDTGLQTSRRSALHTLFSYLLSAFTGALGLLNWLTLRSFVLDNLLHSSISEEAWRAVDNFTFVTFGILWLILVLFTQHLYKKGFQKKSIWPRFFWVTGIQSLLLMVCQAVPVLLGWTKWNAESLVFPVIECVIGIGLILFAVLNRKTRNTS